LRRYAAEYETESRKIDEAAASVKPAKFIDNPPMTHRRPTGPSPRQPWETEYLLLHPL
jgi:hypothetical protein